jgi:hypothetical protein
MLNVEEPRRGEVGQEAADKSLRTASRVDVALLPR